MSLIALLKKEKLALVLIFLAALAIRLAYLLSIKHLPTFAYPLLDAQVHDVWALEIINKSFFGNAAFFRAPLYAYFLAFIYKIFGHSFFLARLIQLLIGSLNCCLIYILTLQIFKKQPIALIAAFISIFYWVFIYFEAELLIPFMLVFLNSLAFIFLIEAVEAKKNWLFFISGFIFGLSSIARPNILIFMPFVFFWMFFVLRKDLIFKTLVIFTLAVSLPVFAITLHNYIVGDDFVLIASQGGVNFYIGNNEFSDGKTAIVPGTRGTFWGGYFDTINIAQAEMGRSLKPSEVSAYWYKKGLNFIVNKPAKAVKLYLHKLHLFFNNIELSNNKNIYFFRDQSNILRWPVFFNFALIAPLGFAGLIFAKKDKYYWLLLGFLATYSISILLFFINARYRVPLMPIIIMFAAQALYSIYKDKRFIIIIVALLFALMLHFNSVTKTDLSKTNDGHYIFANAYFRAGNLGKAFELYQKTTELKFPYKSRSYKNLGLIYLLWGKEEQAKSHFLKGVSAEAALIPEIISELISRSQTKLLLNLLDELKAAYPLYAVQGYKRLGDYFIQERRFDLAKKHYLLALKLGDEDVGLLVNLGNIYSIDSAGRKKAEKYYLKALSLEPGNKAALNNLKRLQKGD